GRQRGASGTIKRGFHTLSTGDKGSGGSRFSPGDSPPREVSDEKIALATSEPGESAVPRRGLSPPRFLPLFRRMISYEGLRVAEKLVVKHARGTGPVEPAG